MSALHLSSGVLTIHGMIQNARRSSRVSALHLSLVAVSRSTRGSALHLSTVTIADWPLSVSSVVNNFNQKHAKAQDTVTCLNLRLQVQSGMNEGCASS